MDILQALKHFESKSPRNYTPRSNIAVLMDAADDGDLKRSVDALVDSGAVERLMVPAPDRPGRIAVYRITA